jgi:HK97 family phage major capsid protein
MVSTTAGSGDEWVPTFATSELWRDIHLATTIAAQFRRVDMPTNPYDLPTETADIAFKYASAENTAVTATNPTTGKATLTAKKIQAEVDFSGEVTEDSIIPIVSTLRADLVRKGAQTIDDLVVHGDTETAATGNVNSDDAAPDRGLVLPRARRPAEVLDRHQHRPEAQRECGADRGADQHDPCPARQVRRVPEDLIIASPARRPTSRS